MGAVILAAALAALAALQAGGVELKTARLSVEGGEIVYDSGGAGPTVVFLHGAFMDRRSWDAQIAPFAKRFRVVRYDIRPFGESSTPAKPYDVPEDLRRLLDHLKVDRAHLVGHSFGGGLALDFTLRHPDRVASLVVAGAVPGGFVAPEEERRLIGPIFAAAKQGDEAIVKAWLDHPMWSVAVTRPALRQELGTMTRRNLAPFRLPFAPYLPIKPTALERLSEVRTPTLVIVGDRDMPSLKDAAGMMAARIPGATLKVVAGADHALPLGWADEFNEAVIGFIAAARR